jgi:hypothetical protein
MGGHVRGVAMNALMFDPDEIMKEVRAKANLSFVATTATSLPKDQNRRNVATVAGDGALDTGTKSSDVASVARPLAPTASNDCLRIAIEERAGLAAGVPAVYLAAWARLNCQKPASVSEPEWRRALDDGGQFLDHWGYVAHAFGWTPGEIFEVSVGLVWRLSGEPVEFIGSQHVKLSGGRTIRRTEMKGRA